MISQDNAVQNRVVQVYSTIDTTSNISKCQIDTTSNNTENQFILSNCNLRSAWDLCNNIGTGIHCLIQLPIRALIIMNMSYDSLFLLKGNVK